MRQFRDAAGVEWRVFQAERNADAERRRDHLLPIEYREGWLVFEAATEKRRLAPVPENWNECSDEALAALCASAAVQTHRASVADKTSRVESGSDLVSELHAVEKTLTKSLSEVCDRAPAEELDTGELIRVEETLAIAAEAAKEAISLHRKRRNTTSAREQHGHLHEEHPTTER